MSGGLTDADRDDLYADDLMYDNLHSVWAREMLERTVEAIVARHVAAALAGSTDPTPPHCDTCGDTGHIAWMVEMDPTCSLEPDADGTIPCPDCAGSTDPTPDTRTNVAGDIRCRNCGEYVNVRCWKCGTPRGELPALDARIGCGHGAPRILGWCSVCGALPTDALDPTHPDKAVES